MPFPKEIADLEAKLSLDVKRAVKVERARIVALIRREADVEPDASLMFTHHQLLAIVRRLADQIAGAKGLHVEPLDSSGEES